MTDTPQGDAQVAVPNDRFADRIRRGAAFLDIERPGWRDEVDVDTLELSDCTRCVLGQLAGGEIIGWSLLLRQFKIDGLDNADQFGFSLSDDEYESRVDELDVLATAERIYAPLTQGWREYIEATR